MKRRETSHLILQRDVGLRRFKPVEQLFGLVHRRVEFVEVAVSQHMIVDDVKLPSSLCIVSRKSPVRKELKAHIVERVVIALAWEVEPANVSAR